MHSATKLNFVLIIINDDLRASKAKANENFPAINFPAMGAHRSSYELLAPPSSFLHIDDFPLGPEQLARELRRLDKSDEEYQRFFAHVGRGGYRGAPISALCR